MSTCRRRSGRFRLEYANEASEDATTIAPAEVVGLTLGEILPGAPDSITAFLDQVIDDVCRVDLGEVEYGDDRIPPSVFTMKVFPIAQRRVAVDVPERHGGAYREDGEMRRSSL